MTTPDALHLVSSVLQKHFTELHQSLFCQVSGQISLSSGHQQFSDFVSLQPLLIAITQSKNQAVTTAEQRRITLGIRFGRTGYAVAIMPASLNAHSQPLNHATECVLNVREALSRRDKGA